MTDDLRAARPRHARRSAQSHEPATQHSPWFAPLLRRIHFYAGVFVGPFILIAALTGALYAFSPQLERMIYSEELHAASDSAEHMPLADQVAAAEEYVAGESQLEAVRPAPEPGETTRVIYEYDSPDESSHVPQRGIFIDPATAEVRGDEAVYGTSGSLPVRTEIAQMHRHLFLGDWGRIYSELAASWLGVVILAGVGLWLTRWQAVRKSRRKRHGLLLPDNSAPGLRRTRSWHASLGIWVAAGGMFLAATGITWSTYGGANVTELRSTLNWETPAVETQLDSEDEQDHSHDSHAHHDHGDHSEDEEAAATDPSAIDDVLHAAREAGFTSTHIEITVPPEDGEAWSMEDVSQQSPTPEIQSVAVDPLTHEVSDELAWDDYPFMAQLAQWGIWIHMGTLFGLPNQILLFVTALSIAALVLLGYRMWWQRRPTRGLHRGRFGPLPQAGALRRAPWWGKVLVVGSLGLIGWFLPVLGISLIGFILLDVALHQFHRRKTASTSQ